MVVSEPGSGRQVQKNPRTVKVGEQVDGVVVCGGGEVGGTVCGPQWSNVNQVGAEVEKVWQMAGGENGRVLWLCQNRWQ